MKKGLVFAGLFLFSIIFANLIVSAEDSNDFVTETITCKFSNSQEIENCTNIFLKESVTHTFSSSGESVSKEIIKQNFTQTSCSDVDGCSMKISGSTGQKIRWTSSCDGRNPRSEDITMIGNGLHFTTIDGKDETIELECKKIPQIFEFLASGWDLLASKGLLLIYRDRVGFRDFAGTCLDGTLEVFNGNGSTSCKNPGELDNELSKICENHCSQEGVNQFGNCLGSRAYNEMCIKDTNENVKP